MTRTKRLGGLFICALVTLWVYPKDRLPNVSVAENEGGFGQLYAIFGLLAVGGQVGHYCASPSLIDGSSCRYQHWFSVGDAPAGLWYLIVSEGSGYDLS